MQVEDWPLSRIIRYERNPRKRSKKSVAKIAASIKEFGPRQPIVVDDAGVILVGHGRLDGAELLAMETFPVHQALGLSEQQKTAYRIADNRTSEESEFDEELLKLELGSLEGFDLSMTGFDLRQVNSYLRGGPVDGEDDIPEAGPAVTQRGDLWIMGEHRLLCGDATSAADVALAMNGERAHLVYTDPPYGVDYDGGTTVRDKLQGDTSTELYAPACLAAFRHSDGSAPLYLWHAGVKGIAAAAAAAAAAAGYTIRCEIVWNKNLAQFGSLLSQYKQKHEPCYYCFKKAPRWFGPTNEVTVWDCERAWEKFTGKTAVLERREVAA